MIIAVDTYYFGNKAKTVGIIFKDWSSETIDEIVSEITICNEPYISGQFYKRELPCIKSLLANKLKHIHQEAVEAIIVDGFCYVKDGNKYSNNYGLGGHLYDDLYGDVPIVGIAKTNLMTVNECKKAVFRGQSKKPLFVSSVGVNVDSVALKVAKMAGNHRIPTLLKELDRLTKTDLE